MSLLDRVKNRAETDLDDDELQMMLDSENQEIINRYGPHSIVSDPITERLEGSRQRLVVKRPIDVSQPVVVTEYVTEYGFGETPYLMAAADYRIWPDGFIIERLSTGPTGRRRWANQVEVTYVPVNDGDQRQEVIIKLVLLAIEYDAVSVRTVGDVSANNLDYTQEREKLLTSLAPRGGMYMA